MQTPPSRKPYGYTGFALTRSAVVVLHPSCDALLDPACEDCLAEPS